jgi:hypothetical protein
VNGPSRIWYWVGGALAAAGVGAAAFLLVNGVLGFVNRVDDFQRVPLGRQSTVVFEGTGGHTLYYERRFSNDGGVPAFDVELVSEEGGEPVVLSEYGSRVTYDVGRHHGRALYSFRITEPGRYLLRVGSPATRFGDGAGGREGPTTGEVVAVGRGLGRGLPLRIVTAALVGLLGLGGGAALIIVTAVKRHAARTRRPPDPGPSWA